MIHREIKKNYVLGIIPARGGSKSIPLKNMAKLYDRPLITFVMEAAGGCSGVDMVVCSTDHDIIARYCRDNNVFVIQRPQHLAGDDVPVSKAIIHVIEEFYNKEGWIPEFLPLLQPTSPFLLPEHINACIERLRSAPEADSCQTITSLPHNHHALNQRIVEGDRVRFRFLEERRKCYNKQSKPKHYVFGNLVVSRSSSILAGKDPFGDYSLYFEIDPHYAIDVDGPDDLDYADYLLRTGKVSLK